MQTSSLIRHLRVLQVIVTSHLFPKAKFSLDRLRALSALVGRDRLVVDVRQVIECRQHFLPTYFFCQLSTKGTEMVCRNEQMAGHHRYGGMPRYQVIQETRCHLY